MSKRNKYSVWAELRQTVTVDISAKSLDEALERAKELKEGEFVTVEGEYVNGKFEVTGVIKNAD
ncbi:hypothetical protein LCGC14_2883040 [marine sediment metagenome]|uniref:Uncharacterized protein n=1 Tax=marine sediment metagenome TaxID=412755 RepID=A0A0F9AQP1_9ZZZZ